MHPLKGNQLIYIDEKGKHHKAFVADIDDKIGFTLVALDTEKSKEVIGDEGEIWCIVREKGKMHKAWQTKEMWKAMMEEIKSGTFDCLKMYKKAGVGVNDGGFQTECAFK